MYSRRDTFFSAFHAFPYFTKEMLNATAKRFSMPRSTLNSYIYKGLRDTQIISLKRNHYVTRSFYENHKTDTSYLFSLSNILLKPSYISLESALQYYGLFAEAINYTITSVTLKLPRKFKNRTGLYSYRKMSNKLFTGFKTVKEPLKNIISSRNLHASSENGELATKSYQDARNEVECASPARKKEKKDTRSARVWPKRENCSRKYVFQGFHKDAFEFTIALPHKAVFDYLYYQTNRFTKNVHEDLLEELRIDTDSLPPEEKKSLEVLLAHFTSIKMHT